MKTLTCPYHRVPTMATILCLLEISAGLAELAAQNFFPVLPGRLANDSFATVPFTAGTNTAGRFQQVYDAAGFTEVGGNRPFYIQVIRFREDENHFVGFASRFPDFQINLSTTSRSVDGLSSVFSENVGANEAIVVPRGPFEINSGGLIGLAASPFYYDPSQGNLLLDIRNFGGGRTIWSVPPFEGAAYIDASNVQGDRVSSVYADSVSAAAGITSTLGLVTEFWITPVPEPSTVVLLLAGLAGFGVLARQRSGRKR